MSFWSNEPKREIRIRAIHRASGFSVVGGSTKGRKTIVIFLLFTMEHKLARLVVWWNREVIAAFSRRGCNQEGLMRHITCTAVMVASLAFGTVAASATDYGEKLASWLQLTQATETPREETAVPAPSEAIATVLDEQDVMSVLGLRVRSSAGEDMGRIINVVVDGTGGGCRHRPEAFVVCARKIAADWNAICSGRQPDHTLGLRDQGKWHRSKDGVPGDAQQREPAAVHPPIAPSSSRTLFAPPAFLVPAGLIGSVFFVATVLTGFGPFVAVYLTSQHWTQSISAWC